MTLQVKCAPGIVENAQNLQVLYGYYIFMCVCITRHIETGRKDRKEPSKSRTKTTTTTAIKTKSYRTHKKIGC